MLKEKLRAAENKAKAFEFEALGDHQCDTRSFSNAVKAYDRALALDPDNDKIQNKRDGAARMAKAQDLKIKAEDALASGDFPAATDLFQAALKQNQTAKRLQMN